MQYPLHPKLLLVTKKYFKQATNDLVVTYHHLLISPAVSLKESQALSPPINPISKSPTYKVWFMFVISA